MKARSTLAVAVLVALGAAGGAAATLVGSGASPQVAERQAATSAHVTYKLRSGTTSTYDFDLVNDTTSTDTILYFYFVTPAGTTIAAAQSDAGPAALGQPDGKAEEV